MSASGPGANGRRSPVAAVTALGAALALAACATHRPYPAHWSPLPAPAAADCRGFAGAYADRDGTGRASLVNGLFGRYTRHYRDARVTSRFVPGGGLEAAVRDAGEPANAPRTVADTGHVACEDGRLMLRDTHTSAGAGAVSVASVVATMTLTEAWLVVHWSADEAGVAAIFPAAGSSTYWTRHRRLPPD